MLATAVETMRFAQQWSSNGGGGTQGEHCMPPPPLLSDIVQEFAQ